MEPYVSALRAVGAEPVVLSLGLSADHLDKIAATLNGVLLTGSPADVNPSHFHAARCSATADPDEHRERTDWALLEHSFAEQKPVLAICYGVQSLNVFLRGTLVQDIRSELGTLIAHEREKDNKNAAPEVFHMTRIEPGTTLASMPGASQEVRVNSSHHQSILDPGRDLRVISRAADGVIEAVEWAGDANWVLGVQWHPERMASTDELSQSLFRSLVRAARKVSADA